MGCPMMSTFGLLITRQAPSTAMGHPHAARGGPTAGSGAAHRSGMYPGRRPLVDDDLADQLLGKALAEGAELLGPDGLLAQLTKVVLERALAEEITGHLGYDKRDPAGRGSGNSRNGTTPETLLIDAGAVDLVLPAGVRQVRGHHGGDHAARADSGDRGLLASRDPRERPWHQAPPARRC